MQCKDEPMTPEQIRWLTWGAVQHRPHGAPRWDEPGTHRAISEHCGTWGLEVATEHVLAHARDPKAKTPFAIKGSAPHHERAPRQPAKAGGDECRMHPGEWAGSCRACAADRLAGDQSSRPQRQKAPAEVAHRGAAACRAALSLPSPSPAPDVVSEPAVDDAAEGSGPLALDVQRRAGEDRPETACLAPGCYRPTRDGICDRCRAVAAAEDVRAGNAELIERLRANEAERARTRPPADPGPPRYFTSADYYPERVHAAQARAAADRSTR
jgi:hypothetical protein